MTIRAEVFAVFEESDHREELGRLFPEVAISDAPNPAPRTRSGQERQGELEADAHRAKSLLSQLAGWLDGLIQGETFERQLRMNAEEWAKLFTLVFKKAVKGAKLSDIRLHDLRHTHVALLARAGVPAKVIQERVGRHSAGFTLDNYGGTFPSQHREAADKFAALVGTEGRPL